MARFDEDRRQANRLVSDAEIQSAAKHLARQFPEIQAIWLFGSYARGEQRRTSDVDLAVMTTPGLCRDRIHRADLIATAESVLDVPIDVVPLGSHLSPAIIFEVLARPHLLWSRDTELANAFASQLRSIARDDWPRIERTWQRTRKWLDGLNHAQSN